MSYYSISDFWLAYDGVNRFSDTVQLITLYVSIQNDSAHNGTQYRGPVLPFSPSKHLTEDGVKVVCVRKVFLGSVSRPVMRWLLFVQVVYLESLTHVFGARGGFGAFNTNTPSDLVSGC